MHPLISRCALALAILLAGCGGGNDGAPSVTPAPNPIPSPPVPPPPPPEPPPPPPSPPIPADAWQAPVNAVPTTGNYVFLQSDSGDYIGGGRTYTYTDKSAVLTVSADGTRINVGVTSDQYWNGSVSLPSSITALQAGYFKDLTRAPFADPVKGGLEWTGEHRGCNTLTGWAIIDSYKLEGGKLTALDLRFEQHCEGGTAALRGKIHWTKANADAVAIEPPPPIPSNLWRPENGATPATGNFIYLSSMGGDYIGGGRTYLYTPANANLKVSSTSAHANVTVSGDQSWGGDFAGSRHQTKLEVGYYPDLTRYPFHNVVKGGLSWSGEGRGCNTLAGWFAVDAVTYSAGVMTALDLRFEQRCEGGSSALRGQIRWRAGDQTGAAGPVNPAPANLWKPPADALPASGNYVFLASDQGDYIGAGRTMLYTESNSTISVDPNLTAALRVSVGPYSGDFLGMQSLSQLTPGYYADLRRYPFHNAVKGGMNWSGDGRGCNNLTGWFVVDQVSYSLGALTSIHLRFEQHCEGGTAALRGVIHWNK